MTRSPVIPPTGEVPKQIADALLQTPADKCNRRQRDWVAGGP